MDETPSHANRLNLPSVWMLEKMKQKTAMAPTKTAVHVAWVDRAFSAMEMLSIPPAELKVKTGSGGQ